ncbi:MAG: antitoxin VapB family protein [Candidatus Aenigmarchaeota archaeon]|nr:antitoxin VapB family protein [Candidatus Aenigmarchaeota archaeon]
MTKLVSISEEAYERLKTMKGEKESFTDVVIKLTKKRPLESFFGSVPEEMAKRMETDITEARARHRKLHYARLKRLSK